MTLFRAPRLRISNDLVRAVLDTELILFEVFPLTQMPGLELCDLHTFLAMVLIKG